LFHLSVHDVIADYYTHIITTPTITTTDVNAAISLGTLPYQDSTYLYLMLRSRMAELYIYSPQLFMA
jgi:hypothetical protein